MCDKALIRIDRFSRVIDFLKCLRYKHPYGYPLPVIIAVILYTIVFSTFTILKHYNFQTYGWDLGIYMQALYTTAFHGKLLCYTLEQHSNPSCSFFGVHFSPFLLLLVPLYRLLPYAETLLALQSLFIALGSLIIYKLAEMRIGKSVALILSLVYLLYTPLHVLNWYDFHLQAFIPFLLLATYYYYVKSSYLKSLLFIVLTLSTFEIMPILILPFGIYVLIKRLRDRKALIYALCVIGLCITWLLVASSVIQIFNPNRFKNYVNPWAHFGETPSEIVFNVLTKPVDAIQHFFTYAPLEKGLYLLWLLLPLLFAPLRAPLEFLMLVMPWPTLAFLSNYTGYLGLQYTGFVVGQVFIAATEGLKRMADSAPEPSREWLLRKSCREMLVASIIIVLIVNPCSPIPSINDIYVGGIPEPTTHKQLLREVLALIPPNASVLTQNDILPHLANRLELYSVSFPHPPDFILLDTKSKWSSIPIWTIGMEDPLSASRKILNEYMLIASVDGILLYRRGEGSLELFKPYVAYFNYQDLPIEHGSLMSDPSSFSKTVLASDVRDSFYAFWWHGPWASLPPGDYVATFRIKIDKEAEGYLLTLLVTSKGGTEVIARKQLYGFELKPREWVDVKLNFSLKQPMSGIEFLGVVPSNLTRMYLDYIRVEQLSAITHETSGDLSFNFMNLLSNGSVVDGLIVVKGSGVIYGPYVRLDPGNYTALFWVKVVDRVSDKPLLILDIVKDKGTTTISKLVMNESIILLGRWSCFRLDFDLNEEVHDIEFRTHVLGYEVLFAKVEVVRR